MTECIEGNRGWTISITSSNVTDPYLMFFHEFLRPLRCNGFRLSFRKYGISIKTKTRSSITKCHSLQEMPNLALLGFKYMCDKNFSLALPLSKFADSWQTMWQCDQLRLETMYPCLVLCTYLSTALQFYSRK